MNNQPTQSEYPLSPDSYVAFDAISLRNLIIKRLNDQGMFTDQNFIGSNLASIIDIVSYAFNTLIFYLNKTSNESVFSEAQLYENVNRIVKLLDYKPIGYQTSTLPFDLSVPANVFSSNTNHVIPRYTYITAKGIPFSFNEDVSFLIGNGNTENAIEDVSRKKLLYQGIYKETPLHVAAGDANETVIINTPGVLVDHFNIDVYVYESSQSKWVFYNNVPNFYTEKATSRTYEKRLNSKYLYEITFGNGINGKKLNTGDKVLIYYLQSSGTNGIIGPTDINNSTKTLFSTINFDQILADTNDQQLPYINTKTVLSKLSFTNVVGSTLPSFAESPESIKINAPANFKSQYRLITKEDFETFITTNYSYFISDVKVLSNWEYTSQYLKYFNDINVSPTSFNQILLNQVLYADSCNFNNIYVCAKPKSSIGSSLKYLLPAQKEVMLTGIKNVKPLTTEIVFADPIYKYATFGIPRADGSFEVTDRNDCFLEITKTFNSKRPTFSIKAEVNKIFLDFFNEPMLGGIFKYSNLVNLLMSVDGVSQIKTKRDNLDSFYNGLSLFVWNPTYPQLDKQIVTNDFELKSFEILIYRNLLRIDEKITIVETPSFT